MTEWTFCPVLIASLQGWLSELSKVFSLNSLLGLHLVMKVGWGGGEVGRWFETPERYESCK